MNFWEAVGGRAPLIGSDRSDQITEPIRGTRPPTRVGGRGRLNSASHIFSCDMSEPIRASHGLPLRPPTASHFGLPQPPTASHFGLPLWPPTASHGLSIWPLTWPLTQPLTWPPTSASHSASGSTASQFGLSQLLNSQCGLPHSLSLSFREHGLPRPPNLASHNLSIRPLTQPPNLASHGLSIWPLTWPLTLPLTWPPTSAPTSASHFGLPRPLTLASHGLPLWPPMASHYGLPLWPLNLAS